MPASSQSGSSGTNIFRGWLRTTKDALLVFEAGRKGIIPRVTRRFHDAEKRDIIKSGAILVFTEEESGIKRWTDPFLWSASRMLGNFMIYREREDVESASKSPYSYSEIQPTDISIKERDVDLEKCIYGSWSKGRGLKEDGMMKKTISLKINGIIHHLVSYYKPSDVRSGELQAPSSIMMLRDLKISSELLTNVSKFRQPPRTKTDTAGRLVFVSEHEDAISTYPLKDTGSITWVQVNTNPSSRCSESPSPSPSSEPDRPVTPFPDVHNPFLLDRCIRRTSENRLNKKAYSPYTRHHAARITSRQLINRPHSVHPIPNSTMATQQLDTYSCLYPYTPMSDFSPVVPSPSFASPSSNYQALREDMFLDQLSAYQWDTDVQDWNIFPPEQYSSPSMSCDYSQSSSLSHAFLPIDQHTPTYMPRV